jgi:hypothetical protein
MNAAQIAPSVVVANLLKYFAEKVSELDLTHFARRHGEFAVVSATVPSCVAVNLDVVRGISDRIGGLFAGHQLSVCGLLPRIAADIGLLNPN